MLGKPGSNPIELFWDVVDNLDQKLDTKIAIVDAAIKRHDAKLSSNTEGSSQPWSVQAETTEADFLEIVQASGDEETAALSKDELKEVFTTVLFRSAKSLSYIHLCKCSCMTKL
jgi:pre-mRNA-processing factor 40